MVYHKVLFWNLFFLVSLSVTFHYTWKYICRLWHAGRWHNIAHFWKRYSANHKQYARQLRLNWCVNNHMFINPIKTKSVTIATRQKHQLWSLPLDLVLNGAKIDQVSEHRLLGITIDSKLRWGSHTNIVCKTVSRRVFLLSKLMYIVDIDTRKQFFNAHI